MFTDPVTYHLTRSNASSDSINGFQRIIDYLLTFVGDVEVKKENENFIYITYTGTPTFATLKTDKNLDNPDGVITGQMTLTCNSDDNFSINLIKNVTGNIGYRIYNPQTKSFMVNDNNLIDLTTTKIDPSVSKVFDRYQLYPLFQYKGSSIFFAKDGDGRIHLVNPHLLEYLVKNPVKGMLKKEFSVVVAVDVSHFVALIDRGLIPVSFHRYMTQGKKIINLSGLNISKLYSDISINFIYFIFDSVNQSFIQTENPNYVNSLVIKKGKSVKSVITKKFSKKGFLCAKVAQDITYIKAKSGPIPSVNISIFLD